MPKDEYLSDEEVVTLKAMLDEQLASMLENTRDNVNTLTETREAESDPLDVAVTESNRDFTLRLADRERRLIGKVKHSLQRMHEGEYGVCESCGEPITFSRLMARPVAAQCIDCKTEAEQLERRAQVF
ncbi:MAG: DnaK suppressor protein [Myxococcota bacterium]|jgi:DnaK suppressor protein